MLKLKLQYFGHLMQRNWLTGKDPDSGKEWRWQKKGTTEDEMVGWHHWLDEHEFEQALGVGGRQRSLACCSPWGHKELDTTEQLNWTDVPAPLINFSTLFIWNLCSRAIRHLIILLLFALPNERKTVWGWVFSVLPVTQYQVQDSFYLRL